MPKCEPVCSNAMFHKGALACGSWGFSISQNITEQQCTTRTSSFGCTGSIPVYGRYRGSSHCWPKSLARARSTSPADTLRTSTPAIISGGAHGSCVGGGAAAHAAIACMRARPSGALAKVVPARVEDESRTGRMHAPCAACGSAGVLPRACDARGTQRMQHACMRVLSQYTCTDWEPPLIRGRRRAHDDATLERMRRPEGQGRLIQRRRRILCDGA